MKYLLITLFLCLSANAFAEKKHCVKLKQDWMPKLEKAAKLDKEEGADNLNEATHFMGEMIYLNHYMQQAGCPANPDAGIAAIADKYFPKK